MPAIALVDADPIGLDAVIGRPTVVPLVGYHGCMPCQAYLRDLSDLVSELDAAGVGLAGVGGAADYQARPLEPDECFDGVLFTCSLTPIPSWRTARARAVQRVRPGGRIAVVDMSAPRGRGRALAPLARLACCTGGADIRREPWRAVFDDTLDGRYLVLRAGHVHVATGTAAHAALPWVAR